VVYLVHDTPPTVVDIVILLVDLGHAVETDAGMHQKNKIVQYPDGARETQIIHNKIHSGYPECYNANGLRN
jgi:hypothetical protein